VADIRQWSLNEIVLLFCDVSVFKLWLNQCVEISNFYDAQMMQLIKPSEHLCRMLLFVY